MLRHPDISQTQIVFVYAGDIWVVDKDGGIAHNLSSPLGEETSPKFSPDGSRIAFSAQYDGNPEVYVLPSGGGSPERITYHPMKENVVDWYPDNKSLLIASARESGRQRYAQFYQISAVGGLAEKLPVPYGEFGTLSPDMGKLAYTPSRGAMINWKRYEGGMASDIWIFDINSLDSKRITEHPATDANPMWHKEKIYFLSDRGKAKRQNIWVYNTRDESTRQVTNFSEFDIYYPSIGPEDLVFQAGGKLYRMNLESEDPVQVEIRISTDLTTIQPRLTNVSKTIQYWQISPDGKRAIFEARGDIFTVPAEHGYIRNLTRTSGIAERYPSWSPDGKHVAYWSDRTGEYELYIRPGDGSGEEEKLTNLGEGYRYFPYWSPDSKKLAYMDNTQQFYLYDIKMKKQIRVDFCPFLAHPAMQGFRPAWSNNSEWIAYSKTLENSHSAVFLYNVKEKTVQQATSGYYSDFSPVFDPEGNYLYFLTNRSLSALYSDLDRTWVYPNATQIAIATLRKDVSSPFAERNDEVSIKKDEDEDEDEEKDENKKEKKIGKAVDQSEDKGKKKDGVDKDAEDKKKKEKEGEEEVLKIELEGLESRIITLPEIAGNYGNLSAVKGEIIYTQYPRSGSADKSSSIRTWILEDREEKIIMEDAGSYRLSANGKKMIVSQRNGYGIVDIRPGQKITTRLRTGEMETWIDPRAEWKQIYTEVWRKYRDFYYDENMHEVNWLAIRKQYEPLVDQCLTRWDLNVVLNDLVGELNSSHTYINGPSPERPPSQQFGMLGVDWKLEDGGYRISHIVDGGAWDSRTRSPLKVTGVKVKEGDYILAVNGISLDTGKEPWAAFQGLGNRTIELTVNDKPTIKDSRKVIIKTMSSETQLRNLEWMEKNRLYVDKNSEGKIGYIYMPNTGGSGQTNLVRQMYGQLDREAIIIDERFNSGGQLSDRFLELLMRPRIGYIYKRNGDLEDWPPKAHFGPKALLINGWSLSGGDALPWGFKILKAGPIVGTRTGGALIGPTVGHSNIDGGGHTVPDGRLMDKDGKWFLEGHGVEPDYVVIDDPSKLARGIDPQMDKAIELLLEELKKNPPVKMKHPPFEKR